MNDFFSFRKMVTPTLIQVIYILGEIAIIIGTLTTITAVSGYSRMFSGRGAGFGGFLGGLFAIAVGSLLWRMVCESLIVLFSLHDELIGFRKDYRTRVPGGSTSTTVTAADNVQPAVQYCPNCNEPVTGAFCRNCGHKLP